MTSAQTHKPAGSDERSWRTAFSETTPGKAPPSALAPELVAKAATDEPSSKLGSVGLGAVPLCGVNKAVRQETRMRQARVERVQLGKEGGMDMHS